MTKKNSSITKVVILSVIFGIISGGLTSFALIELKTPTQEQLIKEFYDVETATHISPHHIRKAMAKGDESFILIDLRSQEEYEEEHIVGALNIPAYKDRDNSDYGAVERIVGAFSELPKDKEIIVYCYSIPCMTGRKVGKILAGSGIYVKHLGVGWNEWRYFWTLWNHPHEWNVTNVEDYVWSGPEPGTPPVNLTGVGCSVGEFSC